MGFKFLAEDVGIHLTADGIEFRFADDAALFGSELERLPFVGVGFGEFKMVVQMVSAFGSAEEQSTALAVGKGRAESVSPGIGLKIGSFIEDDEIETGAAQVVGLEAAFDQDGGGVLEIETEVLFHRLFGPQVAGDGFETTPDDFFGEISGGADVPDEIVGHFGGADKFSECEFSLAERRPATTTRKRFGQWKTWYWRGCR